MDQDTRFLKDYFQRVASLAAQDHATFTQISALKDLWLHTRSANGKVWFIGNGGSAGSAGHLATDLAKNARVPAATFNDVSLITCLANDYGHDHWMSEAIKMSARSGDCLVAISASGRSANVINAVRAAREMSLSVVTLSGFKPDNPLRSLGDINFWIDSSGYNIVELGHQIICMAAIDLIIGAVEYSASR